MPGISNLAFNKRRIGLADQHDLLMATLKKMLHSQICPQFIINQQRVQIGVNCPKQLKQRKTLRTQLLYQFSVPQETARKIMPSYLWAMAFKIFPFYRRAVTVIHIQQVDIPYVPIP